MLLRLEQSRLQIRFPHPVTNNLQYITLFLMREVGHQVVEHLLGNVPYAIRHLVQLLLEQGEELVCNVPQILKMGDECSLRLFISDGLFSGNVWGSIASSACP